MQHGMLFEEQLEGILVPIITEQGLTQLELLHLANLAVGFESLFHVAISKEFLGSYLPVRMIPYYLSPECWSVVSDCPLVVIGQLHFGRVDEILR
jgi:hypothetical protein